MKRTLWVVIVLLAALLLVSNYLLETSQFNSFTSEINIPAWLKNAVSTLTGQKDKKPEFSAIDWKTYSENGCTWKKNTLLSNYELYGSHSPAWDDEVLKFFENYSALYFTDWADEAKNKQILAQADELIKLGCDDPYILYIQGQLTYHYSDGLDGQTILKKSFVLLENSDYPAFCKFRAAQDLQKANEWAGKHVDSIHDARRKKMIYLGKASGDQAFADGNQRYYMTSMTSLWNDGMPKEMELLLYELENTPNADPWIKLMVNGFYHNTRGWEMRGGAVGNLVKEKQWEVFHEEIRQARDCFTRAHEMHPEFPDAAIMMIKISMSDGSSKREQRQWFDRSVAAHFDYLKAYENYFWALRPRWGGSHEEMLQFGVECLNTGRFDTAVPASFLIALWDVGSELPDWRAPYQAPGTFENLKKFYAGILIQSSKKSEQYYWQTSQAVTYWAAGHYEESKKILDELGDNLDMPCLQSFDIKKDQVFGEVNLHTSPFKDLALQAETL